MTATTAAPPRARSMTEMRAYVGLSLASAAISIDLILPAFSRIRSDFDLPAASAATAGLITAFFLGAAFGPIPFGLVADRIGRRPTVLLSCALFVAGAVAAAAVPSLYLMYWARFAWGLGSAGLRVTATASIRDRFVGDDMAREMAFAMAIFITVPVVAPVLGAALIKVMPWRGTYLLCAAFGVMIALWSLRHDESLPPGERQPLQLRQVGVAAAAIVRHRASAFYTLAMVAIFGVFSSYLASSERMIGDVFHRKAWFPFVFAATAACMGVASLLVGRQVNRLGVVKVIRRASVVYLAACAVMLVLSRGSSGRPPFGVFLIVLTVVLVSHNIMFPNLTSAAMVPVGHVAGTAAAIMASVSTAVGALVGAQLDAAFDGTVNPFSLWFLLAAVLAAACVLAAGSTT